MCFCEACGKGWETKCRIIIQSKVLRNEDEFRMFSGKLKTLQDTNT
jgi:hypothetical protein